MVGAHLFNGGAGELAVHDARVDAGFFENVAVLEDAGCAATALGPVPDVAAEFGAVFYRFEGEDDAVLVFLD